jgi:DNA-binding CsgD family transcriptional regulator
LSIGWLLAFTLSAVSGLAVLERDPDRAVRLDAAARDFLELVGARLAPPMRALYDRQLAPASKMLGEDRAAIAEAAGRAMTLEQAVGEALKWLSEPVADPEGMPRSAEDTRSSGVRTTSGSRAAALGGGAVTLQSLTRRERDVAALLAHGSTNREIARELTVSERTAGKYVQRVLERLEFRNRAQVAAWAVQQGLHRESRLRESTR